VKKYASVINWLHIETENLAKCLLSYDKPLMLSNWCRRQTENCLQTNSL